MSKTLGGVRKTTVGRPDLLALAKQGDESAIATLINIASQKHGLTATVSRNGSCLQVVLVSAQVPEQYPCIRLIYDGMQRLGSSYIDCVRVYGRQSDQYWHSWTIELRLSEPLPAPLFLTEALIAATAPSPEPILIAIPPSIEASDRKPKVIQTKHLKKQHQRQLLLLLGCIGWVLIATGGYLVGAQLNSQEAKSSKKPSPPSSLVAKKPPASKKPKVKLLSKSAKNLDGFSALEPIAKSPDTAITIKAVGDIVPGTKLSSKRPKNIGNDIIFQGVKPYLQGADILFGNFESTLTNYTKSTKDTKREKVHIFRTPPAYAKLLKDAGFDVLSVANNHSLDYSLVGFADTIKNIEKAGMKYVGKKSQILYLNVKNITVAFIGFSHSDFHNSINDLPAAKALVEEANKTAEIVVISVHGGAEGIDAARVKNKQEIFYGENRGNMVLFARSMVDYGADLILGHGPHIVRSVEVYKGKLIAYSLGNFVGDGALSTKGLLSNSLILNVQLSKEGNFVAGNIIPVYLNSQGIPQPDNKLRSVEMLRSLTKKDFPDTPITINEKGEISKE
jgi:poly-gamma-glutamate capsule biosynthesis protein CapA/YwtB (metallophosphatase superfamily)